MRDVQRRVGVTVPSDFRSRLDRFVAAAATAEPFHQVGVGHRERIAVADAARQFRALQTEAGHIDRHRLIGSGIDAGLLHPVVLAVMTDLLAAVQQPDDLDGLLEHLLAHAHRGPRVAEDVLVERLAAADPQYELAVKLHGGGRGGVGDDRGMDAHRRTRHRGRHRK